MGKKSPPPKPPDLTPIVDAQVNIAEQSNELAREYLGISREQFAWMKENAAEELELARQQADRLFEFQNKAFESDEEMREFSRQVGQTQMDAMNLQMGYAKQDRERWESVYKPMQDRFIKEANEYDTPERREAEAARAQVDVQRQSEAARNNADARLRSMGLDPSQMRSASLVQQMGVATAANQALAGNAARTQIEDKGRALRADAINMGNGLPAQAAMGFAGAGNSGGGALSAGQAGQNATLGAIQGGANVAGTAMGFRSGALQNVAALTGSPMQWAGMGGNMLGQSSSAYGNAANTSSQNYQNQMSSWQAGQQQAQQSFNNIMSVASLAGGMMMAEGGDVSAKKVQMFNKGGAVKKPALSFESIDKGAEKLGVPKYDPGEIIGPSKLRIDDSWKSRRAAADPYTRTGEGRGAGGALNMMDRLDNGMTAAAQFGEGGGNVWDSAPMPVNSLQATQLGGDNMRFAAEGGRARGALPVRQVRDKIPAYLTEGEYVVPADVVRSLGVLHFDKLVKKYHRENA